MAAIWNPLFGRDGVFIQTHEICKINYHGKIGDLFLDEGMVFGGYCDVWFHSDDKTQKVRLYGGSLFNSQKEECYKKFKEYKQKYAIISPKEDMDNENNEENKIAYPTPYVDKEKQIDIINFDLVCNQNAKHENGIKHDIALSSFSISHSG